MTKKQFVYYEHKGADYILDTPNTELDFIEMLGDALEIEEIVDKLNELCDENEQLKNYIQTLGIGVRKMMKLIEADKEGKALILGSEILKKLEEKELIE